MNKNKSDAERGRELELEVIQHTCGKNFAISPVTLPENISQFQCTIHNTLLTLKGAKFLDTAGLQHQYADCNIISREQEHDKPREYYGQPELFRYPMPSERLNETANHDLLREITMGQVGEWLSVTIKQDDHSKKILFLLSLLTYTDSDQANIALKGDSSSGKTWIAQRIVELHPDDSKVIRAYSSPTSFFHTAGEWDADKKCRTINYERKLVLWQDMPTPDLLQRLRPVLAHDKKETTYEWTDKTAKSGFKARKSIVRGFFTTIFCSADSIYNEQELTRMFFISPSDDPTKIREAVKLRAEYEADPEAYTTKIQKHEGLTTLRKRIEAIKRANIRNIKVPFACQIADEFLKERPHVIPRHSRDYPRLMSLIKAHALLNFANRNLDENRDITATETDAEVGKQLYKAICESNELGLDPQSYDLWMNIIGPLLSRQEATMTDIAIQYTTIKNRRIGDRTLKRILIQLQATGLIEETVNPKDRRTKIFKRIS